MVGPVEFQSGLIRGPEAAQTNSQQEILQQAAQQITAQEMQEKTKRDTQSTQETPKDEKSETQDSTEKEGGSSGYLPGERKGKDAEEELAPETKQKSLAQDEYKGNFIDIRL